MRVRAVVVLWGAEQHRLPGGTAEVGGIDFVAGRHLRNWLGGLDGEQVDKASAAQIEAALNQVSRRGGCSKATREDLAS